VAVEVRYESSESGKAGIV